MSCGLQYHEKLFKVVKVLDLYFSKIHINIRRTHAPHTKQCANVSGRQSCPKSHKLAQKQTCSRRTRPIGRHQTRGMTYTRTDRQILRQTQTQTWGHGHTRTHTNIHIGKYMKVKWHKEKFWYIMFSRAVWLIGIQITISLKTAVLKSTWWNNHTRKSQTDTMVQHKNEKAGIRQRQRFMVQHHPKWKTKKQRHFCV